MLRSNGFLFQKPKTTNLLTYCGAARSWCGDTLSHRSRRSRAPVLSCLSCVVGEESPCAGTALTDRTVR